MQNCYDFAYYATTLLRMLWLTMVDFPLYYHNKNVK